MKVHKIKIEKYLQKKTRNRNRNININIKENRNKTGIEWLTWNFIEKKSALSSANNEHKSYISEYKRRHRKKYLHKYNVK